jgi:predicted nucleic acid-binding protein
MRHDSDSKASPPIYPVPPAMLHRIVALDHYRRRPALECSDCLILETVRKAGHLPLGTFDRNLSKLGGAEKL